MRRVLTAVGMAAAAMTLGSAAGAHAADVPKLPDGGGLTNVDPSGLGGTVGGVAQQVTGVAGGVQHKAVDHVVPAEAGALGDAAAKVTPPAAQTVGATAEAGGELLGRTARAATADGGLVGGLPAGALGGKGVTDALPGKAVTDTLGGKTLTGALPTKALTSTGQSPIQGLPGLS
ncbi:hypothetical protein ACFC0M_24785 [Streptomyces sp. NPDC056149]|uniref:hypothetical protein n=1 Tax=unclassified Streptomyces TaxID=2593676 RepID=UPI00238182B9|nr:hypothetical protein [Streptomyces sp. WZ-12]